LSGSSRSAQMTGQVSPTLRLPYRAYQQFSLVVSVLSLAVALGWDSPCFLALDYVSRCQPRSWSRTFFGSQHCGQMVLPQMTSSRKPPGNDQSRQSHGEGFIGSILNRVKRLTGMAPENEVRSITGFCILYFLPFVGWREYCDNLTPCLAASST
jgi:hypothetical protein